MTKVTVNTKDDAQMSKIAEEMWYTKKELDVSIEVLQFFSKCGFDLIPQYITDMILDKISKNRFTIPWIDLNIKNINLREGNFWESWDKKIWFSLEAKTNLVKFVNKAIYWYIEVPLNIENYAKWNSKIDIEKLLNFCFEQWILLDKQKDIWDHHKIIKNLKFKPAIYSHAT